MKQLPIILDTDPGTDDAIAFLLLSAFRANVALVVSTYGNVSHELTYKNACDLVSQLQMNVPVLKGSDGPIDGIGFTAEYIHGNNGLGGVKLEPSANALVDIPQNGIDEYYRQIIKHGMVDIITLGPLTNVAMLITKHPDVKAHINTITTMGFGFEVFNVGESEFNVACDPTAADILLNSGIDLTIVPLDLTCQLEIVAEEINSFCAMPHHRPFIDIMSFNLQACKKEGHRGAVLHDATAALAYLYPNQFSYRQLGPRQRVATKIDRDFVLNKLSEAFRASFHI